MTRSAGSSHLDHGQAAVSGPTSQGSPNGRVSSTPSTDRRDGMVSSSSQWCRHSSHRTPSTRTSVSPFGQAVPSPRPAHMRSAVVSPIRPSLRGCPRSTGGAARGARTRGGPHAAPAVKQHHTAPARRRQASTRGRRVPPDHAGQTGPSAKEGPDTRPTGSDGRGPGCRGVVRQRSRDHVRGGHREERVGRRALAEACPRAVDPACAPVPEGLPTRADRTASRARRRPVVTYHWTARVSAKRTSTASPP